MRSRLVIISSALAFHIAGAQTESATLTSVQTTVTAPASTASSTEVAPAAPATSEAIPAYTSILDYKSVYDAPTVEEEVKMAAERFSLTPAQQDAWLVAATERREIEKPAREKLDSKSTGYEKEGAYRGLRSSHNIFYETITGYLSPAQKQAFETDRQILNEKQRKLAKLPPPPPPAPTVTVAPVDSAAIKKEEKAKGKKSKKKKKKEVGA